ncbi:hypothetical protein J4413_01290 [Candidatus Woesearchaeota archaeon]|nr:hypothetical protein [Candidatus Woesearchaeota archaeon]
MSILSTVKIFLEGWNPIKREDVPNWVKKSKGNFWKGNDFLYRLEEGRYYRKNRNLTDHNKIKRE